MKIDTSVSELTLFKRSNIDEGTMRVEIEPESESGPGIGLTMERKQTVITLTEFRESLDEKIDNTGNVRDWPSEDILAYYLKK